MAVRDACGCVSACGNALTPLYVWKVLGSRSPHAVPVPILQLMHQRLELQGQKVFFSYNERVTVISVTWEYGVSIAVCPGV